MPEVVSAGISTNATPPSNGRTQQFEIFGSASGEKPEALVNYISGEYFPVLRIPLVQGRIWDHAETMRGAPVAMINQTMARQFWPSSNPVGQQLRIPALKEEPYSPAAPGIEGAWLQIVGVVADVLDDGLRKPIKPAIYIPYTLQMYMFTQILIRTRIPPASMLRDLRAQVVQVDPDQQVTHAQDLETWIVNEDEYGQQRFVATLFAIFSILALVLAAVGLYSVVSYGVATRTNEFGIRMALGAKAADVFRLVLSSTAMSLSIGLATGLILSIVFDKLATKWVNESSHDPIILAGVTLILITAAASASFVPARRAASVDPMVALRYE
jgi:predicted permease